MFGKLLRFRFPPEILYAAQFDPTTQQHQAHPAHSSKHKHLYLPSAGWSSPTSLRVLAQRLWPPQQIFLFKRDRPRERERKHSTCDYAVDGVDFCSWGLPRVTRSLGRSVSVWAASVGYSRWQHTALSHCRMETNRRENNEPRSYVGNLKLYGNRMVLIVYERPKYIVKILINLCWIQLTWHMCNVESFEE